MTTKIKYHTISEPSAERFDEELQKYSDDGYAIIGNLIVTSAYESKGKYTTKDTYSMIVFKLI